MYLTLCCKRQIFQVKREQQENRLRVEYKV